MSVKLDPTIIRATDVQIVGDVQIGKCCVLNPQCRIIAEKGAKIVIGSHNLVEDQVTIHCSAGNTLQIGSHNHISVGTLVQDAQIGSYNEIQPKCRIGKGVKIPDDCVLSAKAELNATTNIKCRNIPPKTCVFRNNSGLRLSMNPNTKARPDFEVHLRRMLEVVSKAMLAVTKKKQATAAAAAAKKT